MSSRKAILVCIVAFVLQAMLCPIIAIGNISPNFMALALIVVACNCNTTHSVVSGFVLGLLFDLLGTGPVGAMALIMTIAGFLLNKFLGPHESSMSGAKSGQNDVRSVSAASKITNIGTYATTLVASVLFVSFAYSIVMAVSGFESQFFASIVVKVLPMSLYTIVVGFILWPVIKRVLLPKSQSSMLESRISL